jgi:hypothetical protein
LPGTWGRAPSSHPIARAPGGRPSARAGRCTRCGRSPARGSRRPA